MPPPNSTAPFNRRWPKTVATLNEITICAVYDEETGDLKEVVVEPAGLAETVWDSGISISSAPAARSFEDLARDEAEAMADEVEAETGLRPILREL